MTAQPNIQLQQPEPEYRAIFEASSDGLVISDAETGVVLEANPAFCQMHGYERMTGLHPTAFIHPESLFLFGEYVRAIQDGTVFRGRARDVRRDGTVFDVEVLGRGFMYQGRFAMLGVVRDVTEQVRAYEILEQRVAERTREVDRRRQVAEALRELMAVVNSQRTLDEILNHVAAQAGQLLGSQATAIYVPVREEGEDVLRAAASSLLTDEYVAVRVPLGMPATGLAFEKRRAVAVYDIPAALAADVPASEEPQFEDRTSHLRSVRLWAGWEDKGPRGNERVLRLGAFAEGFRAVLAVPLAAKDETYGALTLYYREAHEFAHEEVWLATAFADQAALAIENARLHAQSEQRLREQEALYRADEQIYRSLRLSEVLEALVDVAKELFWADKVSVGMWDDQTGQIVVGAARGFSPATVAESVAPDEVEMLRDYLSGGVVTMEDPQHDVRLPRSVAAVNVREGIRASMTAPIRIGSDVIGAFGLSYTQSRSFREEDQRLLSALAQRAAMAIQNARLHEESEQRRQELEALYRADAALHRSLRLQDVLDALVDLGSAILRSDAAGVWTFDADNEHMVVRASRGLSQTFIDELNTLYTLNDAPILLGTPSSNIHALTDVRSESRVSARIRALAEVEGLRAALSSTIRGGDQILGLFSVSFRESRHFSEREHRLVEALGQRAALAIQNARLYEQVQQAATLQERQRLARELHDAVTQTLFSATLIAEVIPELWVVDPAEGRQRLDELRRLTRGALAEMRTLLVELRPGALSDMPLGDLLRQLGEASTGRTRLEVTVEADSGVDRQIPAEVRVGLYRIAQEALNNIVKHAQARRARVHLAQAADGRPSLRIEDDGRGFDPTRVPPGHLGVEIMRERADAIGAELRIVSDGAGTLIEVSCRPLEKATT